MAHQGVEVLARDLAERLLRLHAGNRAGLVRGGCLQTLLKVFTGGGQDLLFKASDRSDRDGIGRFSSLDLQNHLSLQVR